ncbi:hypothetical protein CA596_29765 [Paenibacillus odorifer]|nr:hypothetical protein CA596_29765 [Paenibacillus odorifer]
MNYDRIILELLDRISKLEGEVAVLKSKFEVIDDNEEKSIDDLSVDSSGRDTTKYILDGKKYGKNRLVLAIVKKYMTQNPDISAENLMAIFDKSLQGSLGVVRELAEVKKLYSDYHRRFFTSHDEIINTSTNDCVVCTQWGIGNIGQIIARATQLGMEVVELK